MYRVQGRYGEAERLYRRALEGRERAFGPDHPVVAESLENLAALYRASKRVERIRIDRESDSNAASSNASLRRHNDYFDVSLHGKSGMIDNPAPRCGLINLVGSISSAMDSSLSAGVPRKYRTEQPVRVP